jgi:hypothetical protein
MLGSGAQQQMRRDLAFAHQAVEVETFLNLEVEAWLRWLRRGGRRTRQQPRSNDDGRCGSQHAGNYT